MATTGRSRTLRCAGQGLSWRSEGSGMGTRL